MKQRQPLCYNSNTRYIPRRFLTDKEAVADEFPRNWSRSAARTMSIAIECRRRGSVRKCWNPVFLVVVVGSSMKFPLVCGQRSADAVRYRLYPKTRRFDFFWCMIQLVAYGSLDAETTNIYGITALFAFGDEGNLEFSILSPILFFRNFV